MCYCQNSNIIPHIRNSFIEKTLPIYKSGFLYIGTITQHIYID